MRFKHSIMIPVFIYTDEEMEIQKLGLEKGDEGLNETEDRAFWSIDSAYPEKKHPENTVFHCSGECFVTPIQFKKFVKTINGWNEQ